MNSEKAIEVIKANYPPERYTMFREALDLAIKVLGEKAGKDNMDDFEGLKTIKVTRP